MYGSSFLGCLVFCSVPAQVVQRAPGVGQRKPGTGDAQEEAHGKGRARSPNQRGVCQAQGGLHHPGNQPHQRLPEKVLCS